MSQTAREVVMRTLAPRGDGFVVSVSADVKTVNITCPPTIDPAAVFEISTAVNGALADARCGIKKLNVSVKKTSSF
jgi:hypothetical protein